MTGEIAILNVAAGDTKLSFDPKKPGEVKRASKVVKDMLNRGFAILVQVGENEKGPLYQRAHDFDAETAEYIIVGVPDEAEEPNVEKPKAAKGGSRKGAKKGPYRKRVPASGAKAVAVARTAGG